MKTAIFFANGFEECEGLITVDLLRRADIDVDIISINQDLQVISSHQVKINCDEVLTNIDASQYDAFILPGGKVGKDNLEQSNVLMEMLKKHIEQNKLVCAICAAPSILGHAGYLKGKHFTCFPGFEEDGFQGYYHQDPVIQDGQLITGKSMGNAIVFAGQIIEALRDPKARQEVFDGIYYEQK